MFLHLFDYIKKKLPFFHFGPSCQFILFNNVFLLWSFLVYDKLKSVFASVGFVLILRSIPSWLNIENRVKSFQLVPSNQTILLDKASSISKNGCLFKIPSVLGAPGIGIIYFV